MNDLTKGYAVTVDPKIVERLAFADRLRDSLAKSGLSASFTQLQRTFNVITQGQPVTVHAVRKWVLGESIPTQEKLKELAELTCCDPNWLRYGESDPSGEWCASRPARDISGPELLLVHAIRRLPPHQQSAVFNLVEALSKGNPA